jgi:hypothetical protein
VYFNKLGCRIGAGGKGAQSVIPPTPGREWLVSLDECRAPIVPDKVADRIYLAVASGGSAGTNSKPTDDEVSVGNRHGRLIAIAGSLRHNGADAATILAALREFNGNRCKPPKTDEELQKIANSFEVMYKPGPGTGPELVFPAEDPEPRAESQPFPIEAFPKMVGKFIYAGAKAIGCDQSYIALPLLGCLARGIGNTRTIRLKRTWAEPAIIWAAIVGKSGTSKTPAMQLATNPLVQKQQEKFDQYDEDLATHKQAMLEYDKQLSQWKKKKGEKENKPPWKPEEPVCIRYYTSDTTIEALAVLLHKQSDGLLVMRDELSGWLNGIGEYKAGKGSDKGHWLACWSGAPMIVDRKTGPDKMLHIDRASVSLVGGIQPEILRRAMGAEHLHDGLCARLLLAMPQQRPVVWTDAVIDPFTEAGMGSIFEKLFTLEPAAQDGVEEPFPLDLTSDAKTLWIDYYNQHRAEQLDLDDDLSAAWSKLEAYAARFALLFQLCRWADGDGSDEHVDETSVEAGIILSDWFGTEAKRVYKLFVESDDDREIRQLVEWIQRRGGCVTARDLQRGPQKYKPSGVAEKALQHLVDLRYGTWEIESTATNKKRVFQLSLAGDSDTFA